MKHIVIAGPGRCGTTVLAYLFKEMGYDTGNSIEIFREKKIEIRDPNFQWPHVIKGTGNLCVNFKMWAGRFTHDIGHVLFCVRNLESNVNSMMKMKEGKGIYKDLSPEQLRETLSKEIPSTYGHLLLNIVELGLPYTLVEFPKSIEDPYYLYDILLQVDKNLEWGTYMNALDKVVDHSLLNF